MAELEDSLEFEIFDAEEGRCARRAIPISFFYPTNDVRKKVRVSGLEIVSVSKLDGFDYDVTAVATVDAIYELEKRKDIEIIYGSELTEIALDDSRRYVSTPNNETPRVLPEYTGKGTVVGIIDSCFDAMHRSFWNKTTNSTRFLSILVIDCPIPYRGGILLDAPKPFNGATELTRDNINKILKGGKPTGISLGHGRATLKRIAKRDQYKRHGVHVSGIAAGNGQYKLKGQPIKTTDYIGIAPDADIVGIIARRRSDILKGLRYFTERVPDLPGAGTLGSINISLAGHHGSHSANSKLSKDVTRYANSKEYYSGSGKKYRVDHGTVFAAGNDGNNKAHATNEIAKNRTNVVKLKMNRTAWLKKRHGVGDTVTIQLWSGYGGSNGAFKFRIKPAGKGKFYSLKVGKRYDRYKDDYPFIVKWVKSKDEKNLTCLSLRIKKPKKKFSPDKTWEIEITRLNDGGPTKLKWHLWCGAGTHRRIEAVNFVDKKTSHSAYAVAAPFVAGSFVGTTPANFKVSAFSSRGPDPEGKDISGLMVAPGETIQAPMASALTKWVGKPTKPPFFGNSKGTSMAAPHVAGGIALLKQAKPNLTLAELKKAVFDQAAAPPTGGSKNDWGAGRLKIREAILSL